MLTHTRAAACLVCRNHSRTCVRDGDEVTVRGLGSVDHRDVDNGSEDRPVDRPAGKRKEEDGIRRMLQEIEDKVEQTHSHTPGYVSSSCHNGILRHGCHTAHSLTISAQVVHLTHPPKKRLLAADYFSTAVIKYLHCSAFQS